MMFNRIRKSIALLTLLIIAGTTLIPTNIAHAATLLDIDESADYAKDAIKDLAEKDIITGDAHGYFNPQNTVTRAEMITLLVKALEVDTTNVPETPTFNDVPQTHWAYKYVEAAYRDGIVNGMSMDIFGDKEQCTREQMTVMFVRALGIADDINMSEFLHVNALSDKDTISSWAKKAVEFSLASELMKGTGATTFSAKGNAQRQQVAVLTYRFINDQDRILDFAEANTNMVKYANLYTALENNNTYKGEFNTQTIMTFSGLVPENDLTFNLTGDGAVNGANYQIAMTLVLKEAESTLLESTLELITVDDKTYMKEDDLEWYEATPEEVEEALTFGSTHTDIAMSNAKLLDSYNQLPITFGGLVDMDGVNTSKYSLSLDMETLKELDPETFLGEGILVDGELNFDMDIYVNESNQVVKQVIQYGGQIQIEDEDIPFTTLMDINYTNIGADIEITAPSIEVTP